MHSHLPNIDPMRSGGRHRGHESEHATMRRMHREHVAEERARRRGEGAPSAPPAERILGRPAAALMALVGLRR